MPKLKKMTADEFAQLISDAGDITERLWEAVDMLEKGYVERLPEVMKQARDASALTMAASTFTARMLTKDEFQKRDDDIERLRAKAGAPQ
jgi:hypothetical protein